ncbi:MAG: glycosyltransferase family 2 protein [Flavobacteriaceae bacterium]|jgi:glycosyltransferase involved in cell wall biosynthesis|nr:glycosyltransferase family 2 protein [Flavobacteriaceae bacterium]
MINYTIIIPHKNIPQLLQRCLDSTPRRDDVQIIIIDDNSDSDKVDFKNFPAMNDPFVEIIFGKNENGRKGAGYARNLGLEKAKGNRLIFADADDFFMPCFNEVLDKYKDDENDIIYFKATSVDLQTMQPATRHQYINDCLEKIQKTNNWDLACLLHNPVGKFIKKDIVEKNKILFREVHKANDIYFGVKVATKATSKSIAKETIYCISSRENSLTKQNSVKALKIKFNEIYISAVYLEKIGKKYHFLGVLCICWKKIADASILQSILLLPKMIRMCGVRRTKESIRESGNFTVKNLVKRIINFIKNE